MQRLTDIDLLHRWAEQRDREAMGELIRREINFVYATALRQVRDAHLAEDVTQAVFILLMQRAHRITSGGAMTRWLFTTTRYASANALKLQRRREHHEQRAAAMNPEIHENPSVLHEENHAILNEAIDRLPRIDKACVVMTFLQERSNLQAASELGLTEGAVRMRVARAVEKMKVFLASRGVIETSAAFSESMQRQPNAPAQLAESTFNLLALSQIGSTSSRAAIIAKAVIGMRLAAQLKMAAMIVTALGLAGLVAGQALSRGPAPQNASAPAATQPTTGPVVTDDKPVLTLAQLLAGARARREAITDLSVMASWKYVKDDPNSDHTDNESNHLVIKDQKIYLDKTYSFTKTRAGTSFRRLVAYDGKQFAYYQPPPDAWRGRPGGPPGILSVSNGTNEEVNLSSNFFMELNLLLPPDAPSKFASLEANLAAPQTKLRSRLQTIDGHPCYVIDEPRERQVIYIDASRGFVPLRWEHLDSQGKPQIYAWADHIIEVEKGIWVGTHGFRHIAPIPGAVAVDEEIEVAVDGWNTDHPALVINSGVKDSFFDLAKRMPRGTQVMDSGPGRSLIPRGAPIDKDPEEPIWPAFPDALQP